jgi:hypothetical protein
MDTDPNAFFNPLYYCYCFGIVRLGPHSSSLCVTTQQSIKGSKAPLIATAGDLCSPFAPPLLPLCSDRRWSARQGASRSDIALGAGDGDRVSHCHDKPRQGGADRGYVLHGVSAAHCAIDIRTENHEATR